VVPHGVPFSARVARTPADALRIAYTGAVAEHKGVHVLVDAVRRVEGRVVLDVYGHEREPYRSMLRGRAEGDERIRFRGPYAPEDLPTIHAETDVLAMPSLSHEAFGIVVAEALALGTPVLVSDLGALPELVRDGENGVVTPAGDVRALASEIERLAEDREALDALARNAKPIVTFEEHARTIAGLYEEVARGEG